jgi:hypothetical protein
MSRGCEKQDALGRLANQPCQGGYTHEESLNIARNFEFTPMTSWQITLKAIAELAPLVLPPQAVPTTVVFGPRVAFIDLSAPQLSVVFCPSATEWPS